MSGSIRVFTGSTRRRLVVVVLLAMVASLLAILGAPPPAEAAPIPLTVSITSFTEIDNPEEGFGEGFCHGDYVYKVNINGTVRNKSEFSVDPGFGTGCIISNPFTFPTALASFNATVDVPDDVLSVVVTIEVIDVDTFSDDTMDISPDPSARVLRLGVDPLTGAYTAIRSDGIPITSPGGAPTVSPGSYAGTGDDAAGISLTISSSATDTDGDGIPDAQETAGSDWDGSGTIGDVPGEITDPMRADLFLELDVAPSPTTAAFAWAREDVQAMKASFARAPIANPDGSFGITLWVDTGPLVDPNAVEGVALGTCNDGIDNVSGAATGTLDGADTDCRFLESSIEDIGGNCNDGVDNNLDGLIDGADPTCLVGDNLGGGGMVTPQLSICNLNANYYLAKNADPDGDGVPNDLDGDGNADNLFDPARRQWFRYSISVPGSDPDPTTDGPDPDTNPANDPCGSGGQAEIGGNDFVDHNGDGGTLMHEFGHTLALLHGGTENLNCKANHVSVMNYFNQFGIQRVGGGLIVDYAPAGRDLTNPQSRNNTPGTSLNESSLDETAPVDPTDSVNQFVFSDGNLATVDLDGDGNPDNLIGGPGADSFGIVQSNPLDQPADYDGDGNQNNTSAAVNISAGGRTFDGTGAVTGVWPLACRASAAGETLNGSNEWAVVQIPFRQNGDSANGAVNPVLDDEPTIEELTALEVAIDVADLSASLADNPDPVVAGTNGSLTGTVSNDGPNPADGVVATFVLPAGFTPTAAPAGCSITGQVVTCTTPNVLSGASADFAVGFDVAADLAYPLPVTVTSTLHVTHRGVDPDSTDDQASEDTDVIAVADLSLADPAVSGPELLIVAEPGTYDASATASNGGPSSPMDARVNLAASHPFATVDPIAPVTLTALAIGVDQVAATEMTVTCDDAGTGDLSVGFDIEPASVFDTDPNPLNNAVDTAMEVECILPVAINISPGQLPNRINVGTGVVHVAVLTTEAGEYDLPLPFDAAWIVEDSLVFSTEDDALVGLGSAERKDPRLRDEKELFDEKTRDGDLDMEVFFTAADAGLSLSDIEACVVGSFERPDSTGGRFLGCDSVEVLP